MTSVCWGLPNLYLLPSPFWAPELPCSHLTHLSIAISSEDLLVDIQERTIGLFPKFIFSPSLLSQKSPRGLSCSSENLGCYPQFLMFPYFPNQLVQNASYICPLSSISSRPLWSIPFPAFSILCRPFPTLQSEDFKKIAPQLMPPLRLFLTCTLAS